VEGLLEKMNVQHRIMNEKQMVKGQL